MSQIAFEYSPYWIWPIGILALGLAWILYSLDKDKQYFSNTKRILLGIFRFLALFIIGLLLLTPHIKSKKTDIKNPYILIAEDVSRSIGAVVDSSQILKYRSSIDLLKEKLSKDFVPDHRYFAQKVDSPELNNATNIGAVFEKAYDELGADNLSAVVLISDGIHNEGVDPFTILEKLKVPVFSVAIGDTTKKRDLKISNVFVNRIAYLNDKFTAQVDVSAYNCEGQSSRLAVLDANGRILHQEIINILQKEFFKTVSITLDAKPVGIQKFRFELSPLENESNMANNKKDIYVEILDARKKVLILANSPHPDVAALRQILEQNQNYQVSVQLAGDMKGSIKEFDLVVFHQLPSSRFNSTLWINEVKANNIPRIFIVGLQTDLKIINQWQNAVQIKQGSAGPNEVQASLNKGFRLFTISENLQKVISEFNPMSSPFGEYKASADAEILLYQRIGKIDTEYPLWLFHQNDQGKTAVICGEGLWKWRLFDFLQNESTDHIEELIQKTVTFLSTKEDKRRFRAYPSKNLYEENEPLFFNAELYNQSYQLINDPDVSLVISDEDNKEYSFLFSKKNDAYFAELGLFPAGKYKYKAVTNFNGENLTAQGQFSIEPVEKELSELRANHDLLEKLSLMYGGKTFSPSEIENIYDHIRNHNRIKPVLYESVQTDKAIHLKWIFFLIIALLAVEWFLRKFWGTY